MIACYLLRCDGRRFLVVRCRSGGWWGRWPSMGGRREIVRSSPILRGVTGGRSPDSRVSSGFNPVCTHLEPMKGFPNQIADLGKLAQGLQCIVQVLAEGRNPRDDGVLGEAMVRAGILGTGHTPVPVDEYIREQLTKTEDRQSFRTSARGLRELYRLLGLIDHTGGTVIVTPDGRQAAAFAGQPLALAQIKFWRRVISNFQHFGGDQTASHPYQVLLRLVARRPGITRARCALALEARDDSP